MPDPNHHPKCPRCRGEGFYLNREGHGYYRDGSFGHNDWKDCTCSYYDDEDRLPAPVDPRGFKTYAAFRASLKDQDNG